MDITKQLEIDKKTILGDWISKLEAAHVLMGSREAIAHELERWLEYLGPAAEGEQSGAHELYKLVAFHARNLGAEARPASAALMQGILLQDALASTVERAPRLLEILREVLRVIADAHALGHGERTRNRHSLEIRDFSPVIHLGARTVMGFLLGPMDGDLIDAMIGRLLRETARTGAEVVVLDTFGAARDNDTFHRTVQAFLRSEVGGRVNLVITGLRDIEATRSALKAIGCNMERLSFQADVNTAIAGTLSTEAPGSKAGGP